MTIRRHPANRRWQIEYQHKKFLVWGFTEFEAATSAAGRLLRGNFHNTQPRKVSDSPATYTATKFLNGAVEVALNGSFEVVLNGSFTVRGPF